MVSLRLWLWWSDESANMTSAASVDASLRLVEVAISGQVDRQRALAFPGSDELRQALGARWKTGVRDRQGRGSRVVEDVEGGRASYRERFD